MLKSSELHLFCSEVYFEKTHPDLKTGFVFYGTPDASLEELEKIKAPTFGFYGEKDARVTSTVAGTAERMQKAGKMYTPLMQVKVL